MKKEKKEVDYSDEFSTLKELHEENIARKFSDEQFNEIFKIAKTSVPTLAVLADRFQNDMMGLLMTLDEATSKWEEVLVLPNAKGNLKGEVKKQISDLEKIIAYFSSKEKPNWGDVGSLANIHESLGRKIYGIYNKHAGYSTTIEAGLKRHSEASLELLSQISYDVEKHEKYDLLQWKIFFSELLEGFQGILHLTNSEEKTTSEKDLRDEAIVLAKKIGDGGLVKYLKKASLKNIQRRISALREEAEILHRKK